MVRFSIARGALAVALIALAGCSQSSAPNQAGLSDPLPPPRVGTSTSTVPAPQFGGQDIFLRGAAFAAAGDGLLPPDSQMTVRVFDAVDGDPTEWVAEQSYTRNGGLPWPYGMEFRTEALQGVQRPVIAAQISGPDGRLIYRSERPVPLVAGGSEDLPMVPVTGSGVASSVPADAYSGAAVKPRVPTTYGIPDFNASYGTPTYDTPVYQGQSYERSTLSGPPGNGVF
jgi:uncharacterized lipoprotein YbaY